MGTKPAEALRPPEGSDPIPDLLEDALGLSVLSPSFYVQKFCESIFGVNPWDWAAEQLSGDWDGVKRAGDAVHNLAAYNAAVGASIRDGIEALDGSWHGAAADSARRYFDDLAKSVARQEGPLKDIGMQMDQLAIAMYELSKAVGDALSSITDKAIIALVEIAAGEMLIASGFGAAAAAGSFALAALQVTEMLAKWNAILDHWTKTWSTVQALMAGIVGTAAGAEFVDLPPLPQTAYTHPGA
ncbi:hypothetical protein [Rhodococcus daqingensis]|uniref:WXG100 family type VII secretion target n=1 Tax=Rhodococcus daqingensis TaxID=2479363 RepID=A0ABW2S501_9NOCA